MPAGHNKFTHALSRIATIAGVGVVGLILCEHATACTVTYATYGVNTSGTKVEAFAHASDDYDQPYCDPADFGYTGGFFEHVYEVGVWITSPSGQRSGSDYNSSSADYGGGSEEATASLDINGEVGSYTVDTVTAIWCSYAVVYLVQQIVEDQEVEIFCDDPTRDVIRREYEPGVVYGLGVSPAPDCSDIEYFANPQTTQTTTNFTWYEYNGCYDTGNPYDGYGWVQSVLRTGLEATRSGYGTAIIICGASASGSGYRTPSGNAANQGVSDSYHMQGRAVDAWGQVATPVSAWTEQQFNTLRDDALSAGAQTLPYSMYSDRHLHAEWEY